MADFDKFQPPPVALDSHEAIRQARERIRIRRRNDRIKFIARLVLVAAIPAMLPSLIRRPSPAIAPLPPGARLVSVESPVYDNRSAESPEGVSTLRLRRER